MSTISWRQFLTNLARKLGRNTSPPGGRAKERLPGRRPGLEVLEDRTMPAGLNLVVTDTKLFAYNGDVEIQSITGDEQGGPDSVTVQATRTVHLTGNVGGAGLHNVTIQASKITIDPTVIVSTRDVRWLHSTASAGSSALAPSSP